MAASGKNLLLSLYQAVAAGQHATLHAETKHFAQDHQLQRELALLYA